MAASTRALAGRALRDGVLSGYSGGATVPCARRATHHTRKKPGESWLMTMNSPTSAPGSVHMAHGSRR